MGWEEGGWWGRGWGGSGDSAKNDPEPELDHTSTHAVPVDIYIDAWGEFQKFQVHPIQLVPPVGTDMTSKGRQRAIRKSRTSYIPYSAKRWQGKTLVTLAK